MTDQPPASVPKAQRLRLMAAVKITESGCDGVHPFRAADCPKNGCVEHMVVVPAHLLAEAEAERDCFRIERDGARERCLILNEHLSDRQSRLAAAEQRVAEAELLLRRVVKDIEESTTGPEIRQRTFNLAVAFLASSSPAAATPDVKPTVGALRFVCDRRPHPVVVPCDRCESRSLATPVSKGAERCVYTLPTGKGGL